VTARTRKRILIATVVGSVAVAVSLMATVGASARDGMRHDSHAAATTGQSGDPAAARRDDGENQQSEDGEGRGRPLLSSTLAPSVPTDPAIHTVAAGGLPWMLDRGSVRLKADGSIRVEITGLVIPTAHGTFPPGTALPVTTVSASLYCAPDSSAAVATTTTVPISASGDATIADTIAVPATCLAPIVLVHPNGGAAAYIAATGWRS
jgi:hypothetical protein